MLQLRRRCRIGFHNTQQVTLSPDVVALPIQIFTGCLPFLRKQLALLSPDPVQPGNGITRMYGYSLVRLLSSVSAASAVFACNAEHGCTAEE